MPIYDQGYRRYEARGPLHQIRFWPITREALRLVLMKRAFLGLIAVSLLPFEVGGERYAVEVTAVHNHLLRAKTVNSLCLECHGPDAKPVPVKDAHILTIFNGRVRLPENYFSTVPAIAIKYGLGHPIKGHPVVDQMDPGDVTKVRVAINCISCHQPHAPAERNLLVKDQAYNIMFCAGCHKDLGK